MSMRMMRSYQVVVLALFAVAACTPAAPRPAMVQQSDQVRYGYSDRELSDGRFEVVYQTPVLRTSASTLTREDDIEFEKKRAYDLALWRAAQIAIDRGFERIVVDQSHSDAEVEVDENLYPGYGTGAYGGYGYYGGGWPDPYAYRYSPFFYAPPYYRSFAYMQVTVTLTVSEAAASNTKALDAQATAARLSTQYANSAFPGS
jgi:hypothetical protein